MDKKEKKKRGHPPGRTKIVEALISLLMDKEFNSITTAGIAKKAGVTEALIYKYFNDKRDLMHQVLSDYLKQYNASFKIDLKGIKGALNKLRKLIWTHFNVYSTNRVFARILLIEVRNHQDYYQSETYEFVKYYSNVVLDIIEEGIRSGELRDDIPPKIMRQAILGSIEHICLTKIIFSRDVNPDELTDNLCDLVFYGIEKR
jgi:AcrR family transcriptional regulator